jgi:DNA polymerase V
MLKTTTTKTRLTVYKPVLKDTVLLPLFLSKVCAGFPSPADDYIDEKLDLNKHLIKNIPATYCVRVEGNSMIEAGIHNADILIIDRSLTPKNNDVVVACIEGELTVKRLVKKRNKVLLVAENPNYKPIEVSGDDELTIWGVATNVIHSL